MHLTVGYLATPTGDDGVALASALAKTFDADVDVALVVREELPDGHPGRAEYQRLLVERGEEWVAKAVQALAANGVSAGSTVLVGESFAESLIGFVAALYPQSGGTYVYGRERLGDLLGIPRRLELRRRQDRVVCGDGPHGRRLRVARQRPRRGGRRGGGADRGQHRRGAEVGVGHQNHRGRRARGAGDGRRRNGHLGSRRRVAAGVARRECARGAAGGRTVFFAFAGYARIATLGEEVRDPATTIPRAIRISLGLVLVVYAAVAVAVLAQLGSAGMASATAPLADAVTAAGVPGLTPVVRVGATIAALGSLLALILGVSRTALAMARDRHLPQALAAVHPRFATPYRAELVVGAVVAVLAGVLDLRGAIGFSSFAVLVYYAIANASAFTLGARLIPLAGLVGCLVLAFTLPVASVLTGTAVMLVGAALYAAVGRRV